MKAKVTSDNRFIQIYESSTQESKQLQFSFKKRIAAWRWHPLVKSGVWDGFITYIDKFNRIPVGLWHELKNMAEKFDYELDIEGFDVIYDYLFDPVDFDLWVDEFFKGAEKQPRDYQRAAAASIIQYRRSTSEIATSAGKTLIIFMVFAYLKERGITNKMLMIVPNTNLILQTLDDFEEYNRGKIKYKVQKIYGGTSKEVEPDADFVIGTFQSLVKLPGDWFDDIDAISVDEAHYTHAKSIKDIISRVSNVKYSFGMSGTLKAAKGTADSFTLQAYLGPKINEISAKFLIDNNYASGVKIKVIRMRYLDDDIIGKLYQLRLNKTADDGAKHLNTEKKVVIENRARFNFLMNIFAKTTKNSLVLFADIKHGYGKSMYDWLRNNTQKRCYYVDGGTSPSKRAEYFEEFESGTDKIMIASFGTLSTGISINNIHNIFFTESYKSDRIIRQSIGRGMRKHEAKDDVVIYDFADDFCYRSPDGKKILDANYLHKHGLERIRTYQDQGFPYKVYKVNF